MSPFVAIDKEHFPSLPSSLIDSIGIPENKNLLSFYVFTLHKCASTMLQRVFTSIGEHNGIKNVNIDGWRFDTGHKFSDEEAKEIKKIFVARGYWYGVYRSINMQALESDAPLSIHKSILLVRDPRDILTSYYFSLNFSHPAPGNTHKKLHEIHNYAENIDEFVISNADTFYNTFKRYIDTLIPLGNVKVFRYEDTILDKAQLFIPAFRHLDLEYSRDHLIDIIRNESKVPGHENKYKHIRKVTPGDYRNKLSGETIERLNEIFNDVLEYFDYKK